MGKYSDFVKADYGDPLTRIQEPLTKEETNFVQKLITDFPLPTGIAISKVQKEDNGLSMMIAGSDNRLETRNKIEIYVKSPIEAEILKKYSGITIQGGLNPEWDGDVAIGKYTITRPKAI